MGTWGEAIFSDDTAQDIRDTWIDAFRATASAKRATAEVRRTSREELADPDEGPVVILALALTQWKYGVLDPKTKKQALAIIADKRGLDLWEEQGPSALKARLKEYARVKAKLLSKQPPSKDGTFKPKKPVDLGLKPGDVFSVPLPKPSRGRGYFVVVRTRRDLKQVVPIVRLLRVPTSAKVRPADWQAAPFEKFREYEEIQDPNRRHAFMDVHFYQATEMAEAGARIEGVRKLAKRDIPGARECRSELTNAWDTLGVRAAKSLDQAHWLTSDELVRKCRSRPPEKIASLRPELDVAIKKAGKLGGCIHAAAEELTIRLGEYERAHALLKLWQRMRPSAFIDYVLLAHVLLGMGKHEEAETLQRRWASNKGKLDESDSDVQWQRAHVAAKQAGKPLPSRPRW